MEARNDNAIPLIILLTGRKKVWNPDADSRVVTLLPGSLFRRWSRPTVFGYLDGRSLDEIERLETSAPESSGKTKRNYEISRYLHAAKSDNTVCGPLARSIFPFNYSHN